MHFKVSVITPVYNAATMVRCAVESAVRLPEVGEVLLIEDGSPDGAIDVCHKLVAEHPGKVRLLQHPNGENRGAGASRNLGIQNAVYPFVAFLDADDWYLENRFSADQAILLSDPTIDGVYNALGNHYESDALRQMWHDQGRPHILTINGGIPTPEELPLVLLNAHSTMAGEFSTDTITVRRRFFDRVGYFHVALRLQQDTHLWKRMSAFGRLMAGNLREPTAVRRVHSGNRMTKVADHAKFMDLWWSDLGRCYRSGRVRGDIMQAYRRGFAAYTASKGSRSAATIALMAWLFHDPKQIRHQYGFFDITLRKIFDSGNAVNRVLSAKNRLIGAESA